MNGTFPGIIFISEFMESLAYLLHGHCEDLREKINYITRIHLMQKNKLMCQFFALPFKK